MRRIFSTVFGPQEPAFTVGSLAIRATRRPSIVARPVTTPSAPSPSFSQLASAASSTKEPGSTSRSTRSRTGSLPCSAVFSWWRCGPPARAASSALAKSVTVGSLFGPRPHPTASISASRPNLMQSAVPVDRAGDAARASRAGGRGPAAPRARPRPAPAGRSRSRSPSRAASRPGPRWRCCRSRPAAPGSRRARRSSTRRSRRPAPAPPARWPVPGRGCCGSGRSARPRRGARARRRRTRRPGAGSPSRSCRRSRSRRSRRRQAARRSRRRARGGTSPS